MLAPNADLIEALHRMCKFGHGNKQTVALRFRVSGKQGYGVTPGMARRCFERMDADRITGGISLLGELSDTENADTQGPVWRVAGRSV